MGHIIMSPVKGVSCHFWRESLHVSRHFREELQGMTHFTGEWPFWENAGNGSPAALDVAGMSRVFHVVYFVEYVVSFMLSIFMIELCLMNESCHLCHVFWIHELAMSSIFIHESCHESLPTFWYSLAGDHILDVFDIFGTKRSSEKWESLRLEPVEHQK